MPPFLNLSGQTFGRLTAMSRAENSPCGSVRWNCTCVCGGTTIAQSISLRSGNTVSCGCLRRERSIQVNKKPDDRLGYVGAHYRCRRVKGFASTHACVDCGRRAQDWSLRHDAPVTYMGKKGGSLGRYSPNPDDYEPRCRDCHIAYDRE